MLKVGIRKGVYDDTDTRITRRQTAYVTELYLEG